MNIILGAEVMITEKNWDEQTEWSAKCSVVSVTPKTALLLIIDCWGDTEPAKGIYPRNKIRRSLPNICEAVSRRPVHDTTGGPDTY